MFSELGQRDIDPGGPLFTQRLKVTDGNIGQTSHAITHSSASLSLPLNSLKL